MSKAKGDVIWEAVEFLKNKDTIEGIPVFCFENLLALKKGETYQEYKLKNLMKNKGLIFRKTFVNDDNEEESKMVFVECVKKYYDLPAKCDNCNSITHILIVNDVVRKVREKLFKNLFHSFSSSIPMILINLSLDN